MSTEIRNIKKILENLIREMNGQAQMFAKNPCRDFVRNRKLPLGDVIRILLSMEGGSINHELFNFFRRRSDTASCSAFVQQRAKIHPRTFPALFNSFVKKTAGFQTYQGFHLFAADGSDIHVPTDPSDPTSYHPGKNGQAPYNLLHLDAIYDLLQGTYQDVQISGKMELNERKALCTMVDRSCWENVLLLADRGYENYNLMAHLQEKKWQYLIRAKDAYTNCILAGLDRPNAEIFDLPISLSLTKRHTKETVQLFKQRNQFRFIPTSSVFDFLPSSWSRKDPIQFYTIQFRIVRFELAPNKYEVVVTNLDPKKFPPEELKKLYAMRWGIETSFRELKYTLGLLHFHAKKVEYISQEIFARLIMYNFTKLVISKVSIPKKRRKYKYKINFSAAVQTCRQLFRGNISPPVLEAEVCRYLSPIRPGRSTIRKQTVKQAVSFTYRIA